MPGIGVESPKRWGREGGVYVIRMCPWKGLWDPGLFPFSHILTLEWAILLQHLLLDSNSSIFKTGPKTTGSSHHRLKLLTESNKLCLLLRWPTPHFSVRKLTGPISKCLWCPGPTFFSLGVSYILITLNKIPKFTVLAQTYSWTQKYILYTIWLLHVGIPLLVVPCKYNQNLTLFLNLHLNKHSPGIQWWLLCHWSQHSGHRS